MGDLASDMDSTAGRFKVYTKTGDKGTSSLYNGERRDKDDAVFETLGDVDELNSAVGAAREFCSGNYPPLILQLEEVQSRLLDVGSAVATPALTSSSGKLERTRFDAEATEKLEGWIDRMDEELPPLKNFILPSGGKCGALLHVARSVCRRAERRTSALVKRELLEDTVSIYLNRLSDYLFTAARYAALKDGTVEVTYKKA